MSADQSAYTALGLQPGADAAAVEAAYRNLIKRYHPDRQGGDAARAAEINWAYHQIRAAQRLPKVQRARVPVARPRGSASQRLRRRRRSLGLVLASALAFAFMLQSDLFEPVLGGAAGALSDPAPDSSSYSTMSAAGALSAGMGVAPLDSDAIDRSVERAIRLVREGDSERLEGQSRRCHAELRRAPSLSRLDQCVAFDEAVVALTETNALRDRGRFSASAVTGRQLTAARHFSSDYLAIESRLDRIRSRVEFTLAPPDPRPVPRLDL